MRKTTINNIITCAMTFGLFLLFGILSATGVLGSQFSGLLIPIGIYIILAISLNLTVGILGELSLGHAGFMCVGAYVGGAFSLIAQETINPSWLRMLIAIIIGGAAAALFGFLIGIPVLRLRGDYLAIVTLGFGEIIKAIANNVYIAMDKNGLHFSFAASIENLDAETKKDVISGALGMKAPQDTNLIWVVAILMISMIILMNFIDSRTGRACMSVRDNYIAAQSVGIDVTKYRLIAFVVSAAIAGIAGVLYSHSITSLASKKFDYNLSILILVFVVLGGLGSIRGAVIATIVLYALPEIFRELGDYRMLIYAIVLIVIMIFNNSPTFVSLRERIMASAPVQKLRGIFKRNKKLPGGAE
ncbi:MAG: branched-chain amino acid ABC transporter permease [Oscillospiraceae bacterium]|nr:branched-chain amino acid ABC transporter permease [Oscillospiraceae bacterium]